MPHFLIHDTFTGKSNTECNIFCSNDCSNSSRCNTKVTTCRISICWTCVELFRVTICIIGYLPVFVLIPYCHISFLPPYMGSGCRSSGCASNEKNREGLSWNGWWRQKGCSKIYSWKISVSAGFVLSLQEVFNVWRSAIPSLKTVIYGRKDLESPSGKRGNASGWYSCCCRCGKKRSR